MADGRVEAVGRGEAIARAAETPMIMLNAPLVGNRLGYPDLSGLDLLELFAFVHPARFAVPTPQGPRPRARPRRAGETTRRPRLPARGGRGACSTRWRADWPEREGAWARRRRSAGCAGPGRGAVAERLRAARARRALAVLPPARMGGERRPRRSRARSGSTSPTTAERLEQLVGEGAEVARGPARLCRRRRRDLRSARARGPAQSAARRGRHRDRQDPGLSRPGLALGRAGRRRGLGLDLHQGAAAPARPRGRAAVPRRRRAQAQGS